jgi:serine protease Do
VADEAAEYTVVLNDQRTFTATVLGRDFGNDLAILKIDGKDFPTVPLGDSDALQIGQSVIAIGYTLGEYQNTVTKGVISGIDRNVTAGDNVGSELIEAAIQTDAAINPGNSGGPLLNLAGEVIGINTAVNREGESIGFALPINVAKNVIESIQKYGKIVRPWLGVRYINISEAFAKANQLPVTYGALVARGDQPGELAVVPSSPADKAGLVENDIITAVNGVTLEKHSLVTELQKFKPGDALTFTIIRKGEEKKITVTLEERKN